MSLGQITGSNLEFHLLPEILQAYRLEQFVATNCRLTSTFYEYWVVRLSSICTTDHWRSMERFFFKGLLEWLRNKDPRIWPKVFTVNIFLAIATYVEKHAWLVCRRGYKMLFKMLFKRCLCGETAAQTEQRTDWTTSLLRGGRFWWRNRIRRFWRRGDSGGEVGGIEYWLIGRR